MGASRGLPVLALIASLVAVASCGDSTEEDPDTQCTDACNAINDCSDVLEPCKPGQFVDACKKDLEAGDEARKAEVACLLSTKTCEEIPGKCYGSEDRCAGVKCQ